MFKLSAPIIQTQENLALLCFCVYFQAALEDEIRGVSHRDILGSNLALELSASNLDGNEQMQWFHDVISPQTGHSR